jgi:hypothetical protein
MAPRLIDGLRMERAHAWTKRASAFRSASAQISLISVDEPIG